MQISLIAIERLFARLQAPLASKQDQKDIGPSRRGLRTGMRFLTAKDRIVVICARHSSVPLEFCKAASSVARGCAVARDSIRHTASTHKERRCEESGLENVTRCHREFLSSAERSMPLPSPSPADSARLMKSVSSRCRISHSALSQSMSTCVVT